MSQFSSVALAVIVIVTTNLSFAASLPTKAAPSKPPTTGKPTTTVPVRPAEGKLDGAIAAPLGSGERAAGTVASALSKAEKVGKEGESWSPEEKTALADVIGELQQIPADGALPAVITIRKGTADERMISTKDLLNCK